MIRALMQSVRYKRSDLSDHHFGKRRNYFPAYTQGCTDGTSPSKMAKERSQDDEAAEEESVDILTMDDQRVMSSDEEDELEGQLHHLPAVRGGQRGVLYACM